MAATDTDDDAPGRTAAGDGADPPRRRGKPLGTLDAARREMERIYWQLKHGDIELEKGKGLIYVLGKIVEVIKAHKADDAELAELLRKVRERLG